MKYYLIAGEASGDTYGGLLMKALIDVDSEASFKYWGGPQMNAAASGQIKSISETSFMGFWEVLKNASSIRNLFKIAKESIQECEPDMLILIDYPGFNLRIMEWAHKLGIKTTFYVSPQLWAWKKNRYKKLRDFADLFFVILPFEKPFFENLSTPCRYYGHPLTEIIPEGNRFSNLTGNNSAISTIGLFPGSRLQEIEKHLPTMLLFAKKYPDVAFKIAGVSHLSNFNYNDLITKKNSNVSITYDNSYQIMRSVDIAITSSGTATLELALHNIPQIVVYKTSTFSYAIGKQIVDINYISLVNLIANKNVVIELIQDAFSVQNLVIAFKNLTDSNERKNIISEYRKVRKQLGEGDVSGQIARDIVKYIK